MRNVRLFSAWIPVLAGLCLFAVAARTAYVPMFLTAIPAALLIAGGTRSLVFPDLRAPQQVAIGAALGILLALPLGLAGGSALGLTCLGLSTAALMAGGWFQIRMQPVLDGVPAPAPSTGYSLAVAMDEAILGLMASLTPRTTPAALRESVRESEAAYALFRERGYIDAPLRYHLAPPEPGPTALKKVRIGGFDCEHLQFESGYDPEEQLPGRDRWLSYRENHTSHVLILRHKRPGPWLVCVHGFGMGSRPKQDLRAFRAAHLHTRLGMNVALFTLPVHGPRSPGGFNGQQFFSLSVSDFLHAETQAVWDLRRLICWIRSQQATAIGVFGISLGGYTSAVLSAVETGLDCVIVGVPPTDMIAQAEWAGGGTPERRLAAAAGVDLQRDRAVYSVVSPLQLPTRVAHEGRFIFAATADQFVPIEQVHALWRHWQQPRISWCTGGHVSSMLQREPRALVDEAVRTSFVLP